MEDGRSISKNVDDEMAEIARAKPRRIDAGRLSVYAGLGALTGLVPLPWLPASLVKRVRGALVHDIAARHGLSLAIDARSILARPGGNEGTRALAVQAAQYLGTRFIPQLAPMSVLAPVGAGMMTWALGHLFDRYVDRCRTERAVRIDADEAKRVRQAIDRAIVHAFSVNNADEEKVEKAPEELRDTVTQVTDGVLMAAASLPGWLVRRLDAAFDELVPNASR
jgi:hypothetical protein